MLKENPDYILAFENLKNTSSETLTALLEQLEAVKGKAAEVLNPSELREYTEAMQSIADELATRNPFSALALAQSGLIKSSVALSQALRNLTAAQHEGDPDKLATAQND